MTVHLYDVESVTVESHVSLDHLTTELDTTQLHISDTSDGYDFTVQGFKQENILVTKQDSHAHDEISELKTMLTDAGGWIMSQSRTMSLWLCVSVFIVTLGIGTMFIAIVRRHRLAIESAIYGSIGSFKKYKLKRSTLTKKTVTDKNDNNNNITTATEVAFFPRYSVVGQ